MTTSTSDTNWAEDAEVFLGTLEVLDPATALADLAGEDARSVYLSLFKDNDRQVISGQSDWLVAGRQEPSSVFRFHYHSRSPDRLHFMITGSGKTMRKTGDQPQRLSWPLPLCQRDRLLQVRTAAVD